MSILLALWAGAAAGFFIACAFRHPGEEPGHFYDAIDTAGEEVQNLRLANHRATERLRSGDVPGALRELGAL